MTGHGGDPLDPLTRLEIQAAAAACKAHANKEGLQNLRFNTITLKEPPKAELLKFRAMEGVPLPREAFCILQAFPQAPVIEATVALDGVPVVSSWKLVEGVQPLASPDDCFLAEEIVKADPDIRALLLEQYGVSDLSLVACDPWSVNEPPVDGRLIQTFMYLRSSLDDNHYAHPLDFVPVVDLNLGKVVHMDKPYKTPPPIPSKDINYHRSVFDGKWRTDLRPLDVMQPEGPSFKVEGNLISWQKWRIRVGFNSREGLVLHEVGYEDGGRVRPILHRASLVEMCVPYADPNPPFQRKCAFDVGDYGLGFCANSLELGCDCLGSIHYFDAVLNDSKGEAMEIPKAVCLHEEDAGLLWKHMEYRNGHAEARRSRRLVLSFIATVVNYEYAFYWNFYQDGTIQFEIKLTGELSTNLLSPGEGTPQYGTLVAPGVNAQFHQHMFCARLDPAVDDGQGGKAVVVSEVDAEPLPEGPENPYGNGFRAVETDLLTESAAQRVIDPMRARIWKFKNPESLHPVTGQAVAYKLMAGAAPTLFAKPSALLHQRGLFASKHLWVTPYADDEKFPAGDYTIQSKGGEGLPAWTAKDRAVGSGTDPVVWHSFGVTHIPRPEDFPVMPVEHVGFTLKPFGFFDGNPAVDLPPIVDKASTLCCNGASNGVANGVANTGNMNGDGSGVSNGVH